MINMEIKITVPEIIPNIRPVEKKFICKVVDHYIRQNNEENVSI